MPTWRCPHCSTPQPAASRCWVCHRSSTSCGTCRHFRGSVAAKLGFCGLDRRHQPLHGDEVRSCWEDGAVPLPPEPLTPGLLDLLTVGPSGEAAAARAMDDSVAAFGDARSGRGPTTGVRSESANGAAVGRAARGAVATPSGSRRLWVEVEA